MSEKNYKKQVRVLGTLIAVAAVIMVAAIVAIIISATRVEPVNAKVDVVMVDNYVGKNISEISVSDLQLEYVEVYNEEANGTVVAQSVAAGTQVDKGSVITLNVSRGSSAVVIPSVISYHEDDAVKLLRDNGFNVIVQYVMNYSGDNEGFVASSNPEGGSTAGFGSTVTIRVYGTAVTQTTTQPVSTTTRSGSATTRRSSSATATEAPVTQPTTETPATEPQTTEAAITIPTFNVSTSSPASVEAE